MEEILSPMVNEALKSGILGCIILWLLIERYLRDTRIATKHEELNDTLHELVILLKAGRKV